MTKPTCHNRPNYKDSVRVQDGFIPLSIKGENGERAIESRTQKIKTIPDPMSKTCQQHSPHGAATIYGWDCAGCRHLPKQKEKMK